MVMLTLKGELPAITYSAAGQNHLQILHGHGPLSEAPGCWLTGVTPEVFTVILRPSLTEPTAIVLRIPLH